MSEGGANNSTIELIHGGSVHVNHTADEVAQKIEDARRESLVESRWRQGSVDGIFEHRTVTAAPPPLIELERVEGFAARQARGFPTIRLNINHIVGVFPLISGSERE